MTKQTIDNFTKFSDFKKEYHTYIGYLDGKFVEGTLDIGWIVFLNSPCTKFYLCDMLREDIVWIKRVGLQSYILKLTDNGKDVVKLLLL